MSSTIRKPVTVERTIGGKTLSIETGKLAKQATAPSSSGSATP